MTEVGSEPLAPDLADSQEHNLIRAKDKIEASHTILLDVQRTHNLLLESMSDNSYKTLVERWSLEEQLNRAGPRTASNAQSSSANGQTALIHLDDSRSVRASLVLSIDQVPLPLAAEPEFERRRH